MTNERRFIFAADSRVTYTKLSDAEVPPAGRIFHVQNKWWLFSEHHELPHLMSFMGKHQYSDTEDKAKHHRDSVFPWAKVMYVPHAYFKLPPE